jgi:release factor glutamine methyltransferase
MTKDEHWLLEEKYSGIESEGFEIDKNRLLEGEPLGYVIGYQPFLGLKIYLDSKPLIPRTETEWWTEKLIQSIDQKSEIKFLDLCAGSGAIGCAVLKRLPNAEVYFAEIDPSHKHTIEKNIHENNLDTSRAHIGIGDLFKPFNELVFDVIATNPPYIPQTRVLDMSVSVYEPALALFSGIDGLDLIRRIAKELKFHMPKNGVVWVECDGEHIETARKIFTTEGFKVQIHTDQYAIPRMLLVSYL